MVVKVKQEDDTQYPPNPLVTANWFSKLFLFWMNSLFMTGYKRRLTSEDIYECRPEDDVQKEADKLTRDLFETRDKKKSLMAVLMKHNAKSFFLATVLSLIMDISRAVLPIMIAVIVGYFAGSSDLTDIQAYVLCGGIVLATLTFSVPYTIYLYIIYDVATRSRAAVCAMVYSKLMKLSLVSLNECTTGHIINLMATDAEFVYMGTEEAILAWKSPIMVAIVMAFLIAEFGMSSLPTFIVFIILFLLEIFLGLTVGSRRKEIAMWTDKRNSTMNNIIGGIKMIKIFCWEKLFSEVISQSRKKEISSVYHALQIEAQINTIYFFCHKILALSTVLSCVFMERGISTGEAIKLIGWLELLRVLAFAQFPLGLLRASEMYWSLDRIQKFLELEEKQIVSLCHEEDMAVSLTHMFSEKEFPQDEKTDPACEDNVNSIALKAADRLPVKFIELEEKQTVSWGSAEDVAVSLSDMCAEWDTSQNQRTDPSSGDDVIEPKADDRLLTLKSCFQIKDISIEVRKGELTAIIGEVGSGKSSLLMALLGEMPVTSGKVSISGSVAYVPQEAWVFNATVQENVTMHAKEPDNTARHMLYNEAIASSSLSRDISTMPDADQTFVGERGWSLSGGQKTRLNMARAMYAKCDVYLLDDPLSALDAEVGLEVFHNCICGTLAKATRILATHHLQFLENIDNIYLMSKGEIIASGSYAEITQTEAYQYLAAQKNEDRSSTKPKQQPLQLPSQIFSLLDDVKDESTSLIKSSGKHLTEQQSVERVPSVDWAVWTSYMKAGSGIYLLPITLVLITMVMGATVISDWLFLDWSAQIITNDTRNINVSSEITTVTPELDSAAVVEDNLWITDDNQFMLVFGLLVLGGVILADIFSLVFFSFTTKAGKVLHDKMFQSVTKAPIAFFEKNPVGRILNSFSRDLGCVDGPLTRNLSHIYMALGGILSQIVFVSVSNPLVLLICLPILIVMVLTRQFSMRTVRELKRLEAAARTPLYSHLSDTMRGLPVVRSLDKYHHFQQKFHDLQTRHSMTWFLYCHSFRWMGLKFELLMAIFLIGCTLTAMATNHPGEGGTALGLGLFYVVAILYNLNYLLSRMGEVETQMTSVERICEYHKLEPEGDFTSGYNLPRNWPDRGVINVNSLNLRYGEDEAMALRDVSFTTNPREKIGIVGRTGAGKSSLLSCILRLVEPEGNIIIDGVDIGDIGLHELRQNISVIPQDPILLAGALRKNMDPFTHHRDEEIWSALEKVHMKYSVMDMGLDLASEVQEGGSNFSVGQRQLLCLARALLRDNRVLLVDEATANVDNRTDSLVQETVHEVFKDCTVLTIAHRLNTVIDSDRILVLSDGHVCEFDHAHILLQKQDGVFFNLVEQMGAYQMSQLTTLAEETYHKRNACGGKIANTRDGSRSITSSSSSNNAT